MFLFSGRGIYVWILLDMLVTKREPNRCHHDAHSVGTPNGHSGRETGKTTVRPRFPRWLSVSFWLTKGLCSFLER